MLNGIPLSKPCLGLEEAQAVMEVLNSGNLTHGEKNEEFERLFAEMHGVKHAISMNSCASALQIALELNNIKGGVIVPSFTFAASGNAILQAGASIEYAEIDRRDCMIDPNKLEVTPKTEALMVVHFGGLCAKMGPIKKFCDKHGLLLIEDSAECIGGTYKGQWAGSFGIGCFSFFPTKNITTGEGGMLTTNDDDFAEKVRTYIAHGIRKERREKWNREAEVAGVNFRMSNIHAAIGLEQLKKLQKLNQMRRCRARQYWDAIGLYIQDIFVPLGIETDDETRRHVYQMFNIMVHDNIPRNEIVYKMNQAGIGASVHFDPPLHKQQAFAQSVDLPETDYVCKHIMSLPMYPHLSGHDIKRVADILIDSLNL